MHVKKTITLPKPILLYAETKIKREAKRKGKLPNFSEFVSDLIWRDKEASSAAKAA